MQNIERVGVSSSERPSGLTDLPGRAKAQRAMSLGAECTEKPP